MAAGALLLLEIAAWTDFQFVCGLVRRRARVLGASAVPDGEEGARAIYLNEHLERRCASRSRDSSSGR